MRPTTNTDVKFEHIGAARLYNGSVRIDVKTMQAVIPAGEVRRLEDHWPAPVFDISDVMKNSEAAPVGKAWITRSGKAVMITINDVQFVSPLAQIKGMLKGERKYANVSTMRPCSLSQPTQPSRGARMKAADVKAQINERIIKALSEGKIPWLKPWTENGPRNLFSGRSYTGLNRLILGLGPYPLPFWATYRQYLAAGLQVQKGEHGHGIIYAGRTVKTETKTDKNGKETENKKQIRFLKAFVVFNVAQTDYIEQGYKLPDVKENAHLLGCDAVIHDYTGRHSITNHRRRPGRIPPADGYDHHPGYRPVQNVGALLRDDVS